MLLVLFSMNKIEGKVRRNYNYFYYHIKIIYKKTSKYKQNIYKNLTLCYILIPESCTDLESWFFSRIFITSDVGWTFRFFWTWKGSIESINVIVSNKFSVRSLISFNWNACFNLLIMCIVFCTSWQFYLEVLIRARNRFLELIKVVSKYLISLFVWRYHNKIKSRVGSPTSKFFLIKEGTARQEVDSKVMSSSVN